MSNDNEISKLSFGDRYIAFAEKLSDISGKTAAFLLVPMLIVFMIEIVARNVFNAPTTWAYGTCFIIGGCAAVLGFAYAMKCGTMVRIDALYSRFSEKTKCILDLVLYTIIFLPLTVMGSLESIKVASISVMKRELLSTGSWNAPIWPTKIVIAVSLVILTMQGIAEMVKLVHKLKAIKQEVK